MCNHLWFTIFIRKPIEMCVIELDYIKQAGLCNFEELILDLGLVNQPVC